MPAPERLSVPVELKDLDALFDRRAEPAFPLTSRRVDPRVAEYLENRVRERPRNRGVDVEVTVREPPAGPSEKDAAFQDLRAHFRADQRRVELELRVNQREGWGFLLRSLPLLVASIAVAGVLSVYEGFEKTAATAALVTALFYLFFITIVWVLLWDPIEKLLFNAYLLRARIRALGMLAEAPIRLVLPPVAGAS